MAREIRRTCYESDEFGSRPVRESWKDSWTPSEETLRRREIQDISLDSARWKKLNERVN